MDNSTDDEDLSDGYHQDEYVSDSRDEDLLDDSFGGQLESSLNGDVSNISNAEDDQTIDESILKETILSSNEDTNTPLVSKSQYSNDPVLRSRKTSKYNTISGVNPDAILLTLDRHGKPEKRNPSISLTNEGRMNTVVNYTKFNTAYNDLEEDETTEKNELSGKNTHGTIFGLFEENKSGEDNNTKPIPKKQERHIFSPTAALKSQRSKFSTISGVSNDFKRSAPELHSGNLRPLINHGTIRSSSLNEMDPNLIKGYKFQSRPAFYAIIDDLIKTITAMEIKDSKQNIEASLKETANLQQPLDRIKLNIDKTLKMTEDIEKKSQSIMDTLSVVKEMITLFEA